jgi:hypothetical protein
VQHKNEIAIFIKRPQNQKLLLLRFLLAFGGQKSERKSQIREQKKVNIDQKS